MNFIFNNYLIDCDSIYKYNLKNIKLIPKIKKINISLKLNEDLKELELIKKSSFTFVSIQIFLILYIAFFSFPFIKYHKLKFFTFNLIISKKFFIYYFLDFFFIENINKLENFSDTHNWYLKKHTQSILKKKSLFSIRIPLNFFEEINESYFFNNLNIEDFSLVLILSIENPLFLKLKNSQNFFKNLPYFWFFY